MKTVDYLNEMNDQLGWTDYKIAKELEVSKQTISNYRTKNQHFRDDIALKVAEILGIDPVKVIADAHAQRSTDSKTKDFWQRLSNTAAVLLISLTMFSQPSEVLASTNIESGLQTIDYTQLPKQLNHKIKDLQ